MEVEPILTPETVSTLKAFINNMIDELPKIEGHKLEAFSIYVGIPNPSWMAFALYDPIKGISKNRPSKQHNGHGDNPVEAFYNLVDDINRLENEGE